MESHVKTEWDYSLLIKDDENLLMQKEKEEILHFSKDFIKKWKGDKRYLEDPLHLKKALDDYKKISHNFPDGGSAKYCLWLKMQKNLNNSELKAKYALYDEFTKKIENELRFFVLSLSNIPEKKQKELLLNPLIKDYKHFLEKRFQESRHILSEEEEAIINLKATSSYHNWIRMVSEFLIREKRDVINEEGEKQEMSFSEIYNLLNSGKKETRDSAATAFNDILKNNSDIAEAEINSILWDKKVNDELRKMPRPDYSRHLADDIETELVDLVLSVVASNYDISKKYYKLKSQLFGVKKLLYHERNVPYGKIDKKYTYNEAVAILSEVFSSLDKEFLLLFSKFVSNGHIDAFPKNGKKDGAFCMWFSPKYPIFVMLNYTNRLRDVTTFAHEIGHAINAELSKKQNALNFNTPTSIAEIASTFIEDFVFSKLLKENDEELRLGLMMSKLNDEINTIFRQVACYKFEQELHDEFRKSGYVSKEKIGTLFKKHMSSYMGDYVEQSPGSENWWIYWGHIRNFFYNYTYAFGLLISKYLQNKVRKELSFINNVKEILSAGSSQSPREIFNKLKIDISNRAFWENGINEIKDAINKTEELAKKLQKI